MGFIKELRRRRVFRVAGMYAVTAWIVLQVADVTLRPLGFPAWSMTLLTVLVICGLPVALVLGWFFDFTKDGIVRTLPSGRAPISEKELALQPVDFVVLISAGIVAVIIGFGAYRSVSEETMTTDIVSIAPPRSIAVLPFVSLSADSDTAFFGDGIAEELLNRLARIQALKVSARSASFGFKGQDTQISTIGRQLGVETLLEGSIQKAGNQLRVTAQLVNAKDGFQIWSGSFNREFTRIFDVQDEIAVSIADALQIELLGERAERRRPTQNMEAYEEYLQGRYYVQIHSDETLERAFSHFKQATDLDPNFAEAWAGMAEARMIQYIADWKYGEIFDTEYSTKKLEAELETQPALIQALALNPNLPDAHTSLAVYEWYFNKNLDKAIASARTAIDMSPNFAPAFKYLGGMLLRGAHQPAEAVPVLEKARSLDPFDNFTNELLAVAYLRSGQPEKGFELEEFILEIDSDNFQVLKNHAFGLMVRGRMGEALVTAKRAVAISPDDPQALALMNEIYLTLDDPQAAKPWLDRLVIVDPDNFMTDSALFDQYSRIGDTQSYETLLLKRLAEINFDDKETLIFELGYVRRAFNFYAGRQDYDEAEKYLMLALKGPFFNPWQEYSLHCDAAVFHKLQGRIEEMKSEVEIARRLVKEKGEAITGENDYIYSQAVLSGLHKDSEQAINYLEEFMHNDPAFPIDNVMSDPAFASLKNHPRFVAFIANRRERIAQLREEAYAYEKAQEQAERN